MDNNWVKALCVVTFSEDIGQQVELQYPLFFDEEDQESLALLSFPDSNSFSSLGDLSYVFKLKSRETVYFCHTFFRQSKDRGKPRGYSQKSVVLVTVLPYTALFAQVMDIVGPMYFDFGHALFEAIESCLKNWGHNTPGTTLELPMMGDVINYTVPTDGFHTNHQPCGDGLTEILDSINPELPGMFQDINVYASIGEKVVTQHLWAMWEMVVAGESVMLFSDSPETVSIMVLALLSLLSPLVYKGEFYPYFTIFDQDFRSVQNNSIGQVVMGVTNPFFLKSLGDSLNVFSFKNRGGVTVCVKTCSKYSPCIDLARTVANQLILADSSKEAIAMNNSTLRKHFRDLTLCLLQPFEQYLRHDTQKAVKNPYDWDILLKEFDGQEFLKDLNHSRTVFPLLKYMPRPRALHLYSKFIKTSTFGQWFANQRQQASTKAYASRVEMTVNFDVASVLPGMSLSELRNLQKKIESQLAYQESIGEAEAVAKLKNQARVLLDVTGATQQLK